MRQAFLQKIALGLGLLIIGGLSAAGPLTQPPGKVKGPPDGEFRTVRGTVKEFTTAPKGEVDGLVLRDGTCVHWPPHMQDRFSSIAAKGDQVRAAGYWETGPEGDTKLEISTLTNLDSGKAADNPDRPAPARAGGVLPGRAGSVEDRLRALEERIEQLTRAIERLQERR